MATITVQMTNDLGQSAGRVKTLSATDLNRVLTALRAIFQTYDASGTPVTLSDAQVVNRWADLQLQELRNMVRNVEAGTAMTNAAAGVQDVPI